MTIWCNGQFLTAENARIDPRDRGFTLGDGLYETIRVRDGRLLRVDRHFARLGDGLKLLDIRLKVDENALAGAMLAVLRANSLTEAALRLTISRGVAQRGMAPDPTARPTVVISAVAYTPPQPARVMVSTVNWPSALDSQRTACSAAVPARRLNTSTRSATMKQE